MSKGWEQLGLRPHLSKIERLPKSYKEVEKVLKDVKACKGNLKTVLNNSRLRGPVFKKVYSLAANILKHRYILDKIIQETELLKKETFLREELAGILIYELVFGKGLPGESRPVTVVKQYEDSIRKAFESAMKDGNLDGKGLQSLPRYVRVNTLLTSIPDVFKSLRKAGYREIRYGENTLEEEYLDLVRNLEDGSFLNDYHFKDLFVFASTENLTSWSLYQKNHVYIQDKSSYIPVYALDPKPGSVVIDACAAPGMKTIHIAAAMEHKGKIYAYEKSENRFQILKDMLDRATVEICEAECEDFYLVNANDPKFNDLECILVDPSCSGSGMVNRMDTVTDTEDSKNTFRLQKLAGFQILLLKHALTFPSVKRVVYSTCSISEEENEYVVHEVLNHFRHVFKLVSVMPNWPIRGSDNFEFGKLCLRAHPEKTLTNGFFVAMFERLDYDEQLNMSISFSDKSAKRKRKRNDNLNRKDNFVRGIDYNDAEQQDNSQAFDDNSLGETHKMLKNRRYDIKNDFNENCVENVDTHVPLENDNLKKEKHSAQIDDECKNKVNKKKIKNELVESVDSDNCGKMPHENTIISGNDVGFPNAELKGNYPDESSFTNCNKKKKKKHKKEVSGCQDDIKQTMIENEIEPKIKTKKHKYKKEHSKEKVEVWDYVDHIPENSLPECETTSESKHTTSKKKHKKKHSKKDSEVVGLSSETYQDLIQEQTNSSCHEEALIASSIAQHKKTKHSALKNTELMESSSEKPNISELPIEETSLKKKHKKKCKDKRSKEE